MRKFVFPFTDVTLYIRDARENLNFARTHAQCLHLHYSRVRRFIIRRRCGNRTFSHAACVSIRRLFLRLAISSLNDGETSAADQLLLQFANLRTLAGEAPKVKDCPGDIEVVGKNGTAITWTEPSFTDNVKVTRISNNEVRWDICKISIDRVKSENTAFVCLETRFFPMPLITCTNNYSYSSCTCINWRLYNCHNRNYAIMIFVSNIVGVNIMNNNWMISR